MTKQIQPLFVVYLFALGLVDQQPIHKFFQPGTLSSQGAKHFSPDLRKSRVKCIFLSENLPSIRFSDVKSDMNLRMWYSSRLDDNGCRICVSTDTSTYLHQDAEYGQPSQRHSAQDVQQHFITPRQDRHLNTSRFSNLVLFGLSLSSFLSSLMKALKKQMLTFLLS